MCHWSFTNLLFHLASLRGSSEREINKCANVARNSEAYWESRPARLSCREQENSIQQQREEVIALVTQRFRAMWVQYTGLLFPVSSLCPVASVCFSGEWPAWHPQPRDFGLGHVICLANGILVDVTWKEVLNMLMWDAQALSLMVWAWEEQLWTSYEPRMETWGPDSDLKSDAKTHQLTYRSMSEKKYRLAFYNPSGFWDSLLQSSVGLNVLLWTNHRVWVESNRFLN